VVDPAVGRRRTFGAYSGGTNLRVALVDPDGIIVEQRKLANTTRSTGSSTDQRPRCARFAPGDPTGRRWGWGAAGLVDRDGRSPLYPTVPAS